MQNWPPFVDFLHLPKAKICVHAVFRVLALLLPCHNSAPRPPLSPAHIRCHNGLFFQDSDSEYEECVPDPRWTTAELRLLVGQRSTPTTTAGITTQPSPGLTVAPLQRRFDGAQKAKRGGPLGC